MADVSQENEQYCNIIQFTSKQQLHTIYHILHRTSQITNTTLTLPVLKTPDDALGCVIVYVCISRRTAMSPKQFRDGTKDVTGVTDVTDVTSQHGTPHARPSGPQPPDCLLCRHRPAGRPPYHHRSSWVEFQKQPQHGAPVARELQSSLSSVPSCCLLVYEGRLS